MMNNKIEFLPNFLKEAKRFSKKYKTFNTELENLSKSLLTEPKQGIDLGSGLRKIRLANKSKLKGKSGGFRVIIFLIEKMRDTTHIYFIRVVIF
jgi:mRNA-degrading endonuclease RelE of RelBE toxin-antitoxin system